MRELLAVGAGGFLGSVARFWLGGAITRFSGASRFPWATIIVNITGCLAIGLLAGLAEQRGMLSAPTRLFLLTGVLGGFTTFSAFGYETYFLAREHSWPAAALNVVLHLALALPAVWLGHRVATALPA